MTPQEAVAHLRKTIESQGPDTSNRHYGRNQWEGLIACCDTIDQALGAKSEGDLPDVLAEAAQFLIEDEDDTDALTVSWLTAEDITSRLRSRLLELNYWWQA